MIALSLSGPCAWAGAGNDQPDRLCEKVETSERAAGEAERKSEERRRFLKGRGGTSTGSVTPSNVDATAIRQSAKAKIEQVRAILPQLRQGAAAASQDKGVVPGLSQYFVQVENTISRTLQSVDACLDNPQYCSVPPVSCPPLPAIPVFNNVGSANLLRQVQESYRQSAEMARQACLNLNGEILGEVKRLKQEGQTSAAKEGLQTGSKAEQSGDTDLYLRRVESLRREAAQHRQEADRISGVSGYCGRRHTRKADTAHALVAAFKSGGKQEKKADPNILSGATVIDLKAGWDGKWSSGQSLNASGVPLPKLPVGDGATATAEGTGDIPEDDGPSWRQKALSSYQSANEQVELTEFIKSRPKELMKDVVIEIVENNLGSFGKSLTTGYKIVSAVKTTSDEVGEILVAAPRVIASGSEADARELAGRADRVPLNFLNSLFDDVTGKFPPPRYSYQDKEGVRQ
jgi:hypothetical protein